MNESERQMLHRLNEVVVDPEEIYKLVEDGVERRKEHPDSDGAGIFLVARNYKGQPERAQAVYFRMYAVSKLLESEGAPGWALPQEEDGAITTREEILKVAATHPLSYVDGDVAFEKSSFLAKVLEISEHEGEA